MLRGDVKRENLRAGFRVRGAGPGWVEPPPPACAAGMPGESYTGEPAWKEPRWLGRGEGMEGGQGEGEEVSLNIINWISLLKK